MSLSHKLRAGLVLRALLGSTSACQYELGGIRNTNSDNAGRGSTSGSDALCESNRCV